MLQASNSSRNVTFRFIELTTFQWEGDGFESQTG